MNTSASRITAAVAALVVGGLGALAGWGVGMLAMDDSTPRLPDSDRGREAVAELRSDHVFVTEEARAMLSEADEAKVERAAAASDPEVFVVVGQFSHTAGLGSIHRTMEALGHEVGIPGAYIAWEGPADGLVWDHKITGLTFVDESFTGDLAIHLPELIEQIEAADTRPDEASPDVGKGGGITIGILGGLTLGVPVALTAGWLRRRAT